VITDQSMYVVGLCIWIGCLAVVLWGQRKEGSGAGLVISYVLQLWVIFWLGSAIYALPWFANADDAMKLGLEQSTVAIAGFAIGSTLIAPLLRSRAPSIEAGHEVAADKWLIHIYLAIGMATFFVLQPMLTGVPTVNALSAAASNLLLVALGMECWNSLKAKAPGATSFWRWIALSALMPFLTIVTQGFLGQGFLAMLTVFAFVASFYRPRWKMAACGLIVGYLALSMYVTYMRDRRNIRNVVWGQENYSTRVSTITKTFTEFEFLDLTNPDHLWRIDDRLNQNGLLGMSVLYLQTHPDGFANGRTIWEAMLSPIPRVLWPDKPMTAGSGTLVSEFTGITFNEHTSVGIGHIMEWYVNFGTAGVLAGMILLGTVIGWIDRNAIGWLYAGDWGRFALWWLPGLGLLQVGGSLVETVASACAALVVSTLMLRYGQARHPELAPPGRPEPVRLGPVPLEYNPRVRSR